jgi:hypothetical protein
LLLFVTLGTLLRYSRNFVILETLELCTYPTLTISPNIEDTLDTDSQYWYAIAEEETKRLGNRITAYYGTVLRSISSPYYGIRNLFDPGYTIRGGKKFGTGTRNKTPGSATNGRHIKS